MFKNIKPIHRAIYLAIFTFLVIIFSNLGPIFAKINNPPAFGDVNISGDLQVDGTFTFNDGLDIVNTSENNTISVDQNGYVGDDVSTDGAIHIDNTDNEGIGLSVYSNMNGSSSAELLSLKADNVAFNKPIITAVNDGTAELGFFDQNSTTNPVFNMYGKYGIAYTMDINNGYGISILTNGIASPSNTFGLMRLNQQTVGSASNVFNVVNAGTGASAILTQNGTSSVMNLVQNTGSAHLNLSGHPTNSSPVDGDLWYDGEQLLLRIGGATWRFATSTPY